jgi:hypothetical protein
MGGERIAVAFLRRPPSFDSFQRRLAVPEASMDCLVEHGGAMEPLDLTRRLPRGNLGEYQITGFSSRLLESLAVVEAALRNVIARAESDAEIAA